MDSEQLFWFVLMTEPVAAVILAAGLSRRMGKPKMSLPWGQTTVLGQVIDIFKQAGVQEIVIVTGGARQAVDEELARSTYSLPVRSVFNPDYETGEMLSSIQCGLQSLGNSVEAALIGLGDQPQISLAAVWAVLGDQWKVPISSVSNYRDKIIVPSFNNHRGHPWLVGSQYWQQVLEPPLTTRDFLREHASLIQYVATDLTVLKDLDTPEDYERERP